MNEKIKIKFKDGSEYNLPDISIENFNKYLLNNNFIDYYQYCLDNNMINLTNIKNELINDITLIVENVNSGRILNFKCTYDSDNSNFNNVEYF